VLPIAIPSHLKRSAWWSKDKTTVTTGPGYEGPDPSQIVELDFTLPSHVDNRFVRLVEIFGLSVVSCSTDTLTLGPRQEEEEEEGQNIGGEEEEKEKNQDEEVKAAPLNEVKPGWKLWVKAWYNS